MEEPGFRQRVCEWFQWHLFYHFRRKKAVSGSPPGPSYSTEPGTALSCCPYEPHTAGAGAVPGVGRGLQPCRHSGKAAAVGGTGQHLLLLLPPTEQCLGHLSSAPRTRPELHRWQFGREGPPRTAPTPCCCHQGLVRGKQPLEPSTLVWTQRESSSGQQQSDNRRQCLNK